MRGYLKITVYIVSAALFALSAGCAGTAASRLGAARPAHDVSVKLVDGGEVSVSEFRGKPLVLSFGATFCPHCIHELDTFKAAKQKYGDDVRILLVFMKGSLEDSRELIKEYRLNFMVAYDEGGESAKPYDVTGIPRTFFIDADGMIRDEYLGAVSERRLYGIIDDLLKPEYVPEVP